MYFVGETYIHIHIYIHMYIYIYIYIYCTEEAVVIQNDNDMYFRYAFQLSSFVGKIYDTIFILTI